MTKARHLLQDHLCFAVPLAIAELRAQGGPQSWDTARARRAVMLLAEQGDILLYGDAPGQTGHVCAELAFALAVLAFQPGGVRFGGEKWEAQI